jgi:hypothetical protein
MEAPRSALVDALCMAGCTLFAMGMYRQRERYLICVFMSAMAMASHSHT